MSNLMLFQDDLFSRLDAVFNVFNPKTLKGSGYPRVNIYNTENDTIVEATVPGLTKDNVKVDWAEDILTISQKNVEKKEEQSKNYSLREIHQSSFSRSFTVKSDDYNIEQIEAKVENGILKIVVPFKNKQQQSTKKMITVE